MTDLVDPSEIEQLVGARRHPVVHIGRADSEKQTFFILHSQKCVDSGIDLRECRFSTTLDSGLHESLWFGLEDQPQIIAISSRGLFPGGRPLDTL